MNFLVKCANFKILPYRVIPAAGQVRQYNQSNVRKLDPNLIKIYRFPYAAHASFLNWIRGVFFGVNSIFASYYVIAVINNLPLADYALGFLIGTGYITIKLLLIGYVSNNLIGFVYRLKSNSEQVQIAYINFLGKRIDTVVNISDIQKTRLKRNNEYNFLFNTIHINSMKQPLKLNLSFGEIHDDRLLKIFCDNFISKNQKLSYK